MKIKHSILLLFVAPVLAGAQTIATTQPAKETDSPDILWWLLIAAMALLLLGALILGKVLVNLTELVVKKRNSKILSLLALTLLSSAIFAQEPVTLAPVASQTSWNWNLVMAMVVLLAEMTVILLFLSRINILLTELSGKKEKKPAFQLHLPKFFDKLNASVSIEKEHDILLDHNYDGIQELDNNLPPWWKYSFYISIVWAGGYLIYFWFLGGPNQIDEYTSSVAEARITQEEYARVNKNKVDENNIQLADASGIAEGADIFKSNCAACHGNLGEGTVGPNLTDDYWLHGGSLNEIFKSVKYGWSAKGMKAWQSDLSASQMRDVVSYIHSLHGTNPPNAKAAQGDPILADTTQAGPPTATINTDTTSITIK